MDPKALAYAREGKTYSPSRRYRSLLSKDPFRGGHTSESPDDVAAWCRWIAEQGFGRLGLPPALGGEPLNLLLLGYELGLFNPNLMMRFGLQFGFVQRAVSRLGTDAQQHWLEEIAGMKKTACLAVTEELHGSNVRQLLSTARYREGDFVLSSTVAGASKVYVTCGLHADVALVFAQLVVEQHSHGLHAFLVPLRDDEGTLLPGVQIEAQSEMAGLKGLDYARLTFDDTVIPKENWLNRHAEIDEAGQYRTRLPSEGHRLNALLGTLVVGRALVLSGAVGGAKLSLTLALRYATKRRQFKAAGDEMERTLLSYQAHQKALIPRLASLLAIDAGRRRLAQTQAEHFEDSLQDRKLETFTGALKAYSSHFAVETAQVCREACGGAGCLVENRLSVLRRDLDLFTTMEGDNRVLELMVARNLLTDYKRGLSGSKLVEALNWAGKGVSSLRSKSSDSDSLNSRPFFDRMLRLRRDRLRHSLARRIRARLADGFDFFDALADCQDHCQALARAYSEEKIYRCFRNKIESCPPGWDERTLGSCLALFVFTCIQSDSTWYLEQNLLSIKQTQAIRNEILDLCTHLAGMTTVILDSFELPEEWLTCPMLGRIAHE